MNYKSLLLVLLLTTGSAKPAIDKLEVDMLATMLHVPSILAMDSADHSLIFITECLNSLAYAVKAINLRNSFEQKESLLLAVSNTLKIIINAYACIGVIPSNLYIQEQIEATKQFPNKIKLYKIEQLTQQLLTLGLRGASIYQHNQKKVSTSELLTALADAVEIFSITIKKPNFRKTRNRETVDLNVTQNI